MIKDYFLYDRFAFRLCKHIEASSVQSAIEQYVHYYGDCKHLNVVQPIDTKVELFADCVHSWNVVEAIKQFQDQEWVFVYPEIDTSLNNFATIKPMT